MEQSYKEKYEQALAKAKEQYNYPCMRSCMGILEEIFPELAESGDEKIRKEIVRFIQMEVEDEIVGNKWIAWLENIPVTNDHEKGEGFHLGYKACLERQVEQKFEMKTAEESLGINSDTYNKIVDECIFGEQKPADKVEPKFHEGEWITNGDYTWKIVEVKPLDYVLQSQDGNIVDDTISHVDEQFHSFTIQDAKDGDVFYINNTVSESIMIYKSFNNGIINKHASYNKFGFEGEHYLTLNDGYITPAIKEQRDTLMKAMVDAGYTFDFEKKELKKIEPKPEENKGNVCGISPNWSEEDEEEFQIAIDTLVEAGQHDSANWLQSLKGRVGCEANCTTIKKWSEEEIEKAAQEWDSKANFNPFYMTMEGDKPTGVKQHITTHKESFKAGVNWILKYGVQPKQEWSEEDEQHIDSLLKRLDSLCKNKFERTRFAISEDREWLKSLRPQNRWKPSDEQMEALWLYAEQNNYDGAVLTSLYNDLKKLKGEV